MNGISEMKEKVIRTAKSVFNEQVTGSSRMGDFPKWDSLGHINFFMAIEMAFDMEFSPDDIEKSTSIDKIVSLLTEKTN